jgi:Flp pilus assembly protein TadG
MAMMHQKHLPRVECCLAESRSGVTSLLFAIMMVPLILILGIAIDFGFYIDASAKLNLAADAAAMHAVRAASMAASNNAPGYTNTPPYEVAGAQAGYDWFAAQAGGVPEVSLSAGAPVTGTTETVPVTVTVNYTAPTYSATVSYSGSINTIFGRIVGIKTWPVAGSATSQISNSFVDFGIMIDNSQSMLIGATPADIATMNLNTPCAKVTRTATGAYPGLSMQAYSYYFNGLNNPYGQGPIGYYYYQNAAGQYVPQTLPPGRRPGCSATRT